MINVVADVFRDLQNDDYHENYEKIKREIRELDNPIFLRNYEERL